MAEKDPITLYEEDGKWHADYEPGISQSFGVRREALETVRRIADREGREVREVSPDLARELRKRAALAAYASSLAPAGGGAENA